MKRFILALFVLLYAIAGIGQTIGDAFYVYRNDGIINTFFRSEVDSVVYSCYDVDSVFYDEYVTQMVYTPDSIYSIPLAVVDSVSFVTPDTRYKPGVTILSEGLSDYIVGVDSLSLLLHSDTPTNSIPHNGDKLVTTKMDEFTPYGFAGRVISVERKSDYIIVNCEQIELTDVFEYFYVSNNSPQAVAGARKRDIGVSGEGTFSPGTFTFHLTDELSRSVSSINLPIGISTSNRFVINVAPTFSWKGSLIVHPLWGVVANLDIDCDYLITEDLSASGAINISHDFGKPGDLVTFPIPPVPFIQVYSQVGPFFKAELEGTLSHHFELRTNHKCHYENATNPLFFPKISVLPGKKEYSHSEEALLKGSLSVGAYGEIGVKIADSRFVSAGVRGEMGFKFSGDAIIYLGDINESLTSTKLYKKLKKGIDFSFFANLGLTSKLWKWAKLGATATLLDWKIANIQLIPSFRATKLNRDYSDLFRLNAQTTVFNSSLFNTEIGFRLFEDETAESTRGLLNYGRLGIEREEKKLSDFFLEQREPRKHTVYPTVKLFGIEMLAEPSASIEFEAKPITEEAVNVEDTSARIWGGIKGYDIWKNHISFGIKFTTSDEPNKTYYSVVKYADISGFSSGQYYDDGDFYAEIKDLKPNTIYNYCSYLTINGEDINGEVRQFKTKEESFCPDSSHPHLINLGLPSGALWMCCNYGSNDPINSGDYLAWGETNEKNEYTKENYEYHHIDDDGTYVYDYTTFDLAPSVEDVNELERECSKEEKTINDIKGKVYTGPNGNKIFLPYAGVKDSNLHFYGIEDHYWTSTLPSQNESRKNKRNVTRSNNDEDEGISHAYDWYDLDWRYLGKNVRQVVH